MKRSFRPSVESLPRLDTPSLMSPGTITQAGVEPDPLQSAFASDLNQADMLPIVDSSGAATATIGGVPVFTQVTGGNLGVNAISFYNNLVVPTVNSVILVNQFGNPPLAGGGGGAAPQAGLVQVPSAYIVTSNPPVNVISPVLNAPIVETPVLTGNVPGPLLPTATIIPMNTDGISIVPIYQNQQALSFTTSAAISQLS